MTSKHHNDKQYWLDKPDNVTKIVKLLWLACLILFVADFVYHKHSYFEFDGAYEFYPILGFAAYCFIVFSAKLLRKLVKRDEGYYDE